jgi:hypothetical protein
MRNKPTSKVPDRAVLTVNASAEIFHQHQIATRLIELCVKNPAAIGRDGKRSATAGWGVLSKIP